MGNKSNNSKQSRLLKSFNGHYYALKYAYESSATFKLPTGKGIYREKAVANFLENWISKRYSVLTNVLTTSLTMEKELSTELDIVIHDSTEGLAWGLHSDKFNTVVTFEDIKLIIQVKSKLDLKTLKQAEQNIKLVDEYVQEIKQRLDSKEEQNLSDAEELCLEDEYLDFLSSEMVYPEAPIKVLFAYELNFSEDDEMNFYLDFLYQTLYEEEGFDAVFILDHGCYFRNSSIYEQLASSLKYRETLTDNSKNEQANQDRFEESILSSVYESSRYNHIPTYKLIHDGTRGECLLALATTALLSVSGIEAADAILTIALKQS